MITHNSKIRNANQRSGTTTITRYSCGHSLATTTAEWRVYDPVGLLAENQRELFSSETCGVCDEVEKHTGRITGEEG